MKHAASTGPRWQGLRRIPVVNRCASAARALLPGLAADASPRCLQQGHGGPATFEGKAKSVILINLFGGPPTRTPSISSPRVPRTPGASSPRSPAASRTACLRTAAADRVDDGPGDLIRTYSHKYNSHNPYNFLTGFEGGRTARTTSPRIRPSQHDVGARHFGLGRNDVPPYVIMPASRGFSQGLRRPGALRRVPGHQPRPADHRRGPQVPGQGRILQPVRPR
ncbi:MAG: hypothetical protein Ct9H300mP1_02660 [Planctomycetaceae bacterium]|nr:MAG: hypothetical protein Ct9H300mP1_02660 [Planctomycetaceae bacterium]